jgi:hypothetical protein
MFNMEDGTLTQTQKLCRWQIRQRHKIEIQTMMRRSKDLDETIEKSRAKTMIRLIRCEIKNLGNVKKRRDEWRDLEWSSINVTMLQGVIRTTFERDISIDSLWSSRDSLKTIAGLVSDTEKQSNESKQDTEKWVREIKFEPSRLDTIRKIMSEEDSLSDSGSSVFVTGATGFLGAEVLSQLVSRTWCSSAKRVNIFFSFTYSEDSLVSLAQPITLSLVTLLYPSLATIPSFECYGNT